MSEKQEYDEKAAHRYFSAQCFNRTWDYIDKTNRSKEDELNMLLTAMASLWHWKQRENATATNLSVGYWQVARVYTLLGQADNARQFGLLSLQESQKEDVAPFYRGYAYEALARAEATAGDTKKRSDYLALARKACEQVTDQEEREMLLKDLATIG